MTAPTDQRNDPVEQIEPAPDEPLRRRAEERLRSGGTPDAPLPADQDAASLLEELRVHQIELEMQNDELRRTQEVLEVQRERYFDLYDLAPVGYVSLSEQGVILEANLTAATLLGVGRADLVGQHLSRFVAREDQDTYYRYRRQPGPVCELRLRRADGSVAWMRLETALGRDLAGGVAVWRTTLSDITQSRRLAAELDQHSSHLQELVDVRTAELILARDAAEAANRAKGVFLANMGHELRTPMNAILGFAYLLEHTLTDPVALVKLGKMMRAADQLLALINGVLDLAAIEAGRVVLTNADFAPAAVLAEVRARVEERLKAKGLTLDLAGDALPPMVRGDPVRLRQALQIYLDNAVKFSEHGGITLSVTTVESGERDLLVRFAVTDTGIGISADQLPRLFGTFEQVDGSSTRRYGGTGLGLAIARRLARLMGGEAGVESAPGRGSTFWFTARLGRPAGSAAGDPGASAAVGDPAAELRAHHAGARILLVEDDVLNRLVTSALLDTVGLQADAAADGQAALDLARAGAYDLVLMDLYMPQLDGLESTRLIRRLPGWERIPILALSATGFDEDRQRCLDAGMDDFISKPVEPQALYAKLCRWLAGR